MAEASVLGDADEGSWVRVRTQLYKGDLAKVVSLDASRGQAQVKLVPQDGTTQPWPKRAR